MALKELDKLGPMKPSEHVTLGVLALMLLMWAGVPALLLRPAYDLNATTTALIGLSLLILCGVLEWEDILNAKSAWDTLVWFAALVMMATFLGKLGLIAWFSQSIQTGITGLGLGWMGATAGLLGFWMAQMAVALRAGWPVAGTLWAIDTRTLAPQQMRPRPRPDCPACGADV